MAIADFVFIIFGLLRGKHVLHTSTKLTVPSACDVHCVTAQDITPQLIVLIDFCSGARQWLKDKLERTRVCADPA